MRVSPEEPAAVEPPRRPPGTDGEPKNAQALRCGTFNLIGGVTISGTADERRGIPRTSRSASSTRRLPTIRSRCTSACR